MSHRELTEHAAEGVTSGSPTEAASPEDRPLLAALEEEVRAGSSGLLEVGTGIEPIGKVLLVSGRVAWATCVYQPENLGQLLRRLGHLSESDLERVEATYTEQGGKTKLGRLLEEAGLVTRPVLRRCLLLHVRMALACMLPNHDLRAHWTPGECAGDEDLTFALDQLLVGLAGRSDDPWIAGDRLWALAQELSQLKSVDGFRGAVIATGEGASVTSVGYADAAGTGVQELALVSSSLLVESRQIAPHLSTGPPRCGFLEGPEGIVIASWIDEQRSLIVAAAVDTSARLGVAKHRLEQTAERLCSALQPDLNQSLPEEAATE
jgi:predicted regulator of Ras-like GTPase activity (Roadblock/LC7/MglB family)